MKAHYFRMGVAAIGAGLLSLSGCTSEKCRLFRSTRLR